jgi:hypothetical protein
MFEQRLQAKTLKSTPPVKNTINLPRNVRDVIPANSGGRMLNIDTYGILVTVVQEGENRHPAISLHLQSNHAGDEVLSPGIGIGVTLDVKAARQLGLELLEAAEDPEQWIQSPPPQG